MATNQNGAAGRDLGAFYARYRVFTGGTSTEGGLSDDHANYFYVRVRQDPLRPHSLTFSRGAWLDLDGDALLPGPQAGSRIDVPSDEELIMLPGTHLFDLLQSTIFAGDPDSEDDLWSLGFSAIWIQGMDVETLASRLSRDLRTRTPCYLSEILDLNISDGSTWLAGVGDWIGVIPSTSDEARIRSLSADGRQVLGISISRNNSLRDDFWYARDGRLIVAFHPTEFPDNVSGDDPHALDHLMDGLRFQISDPDVLENRVEVDESVSSALALIGRITETDMAADWFEALHSRVDPNRGSGVVSI